jgi:hypothetical protein
MRTRTGLSYGRKIAAAAAFVVLLGLPWLHLCGLAIGAIVAQLGALPLLDRLGQLSPNKTSLYPANSLAF